MKPPRRLLAALALVASGCTAKPLKTAILGEWKLQCRTEKESTSKCLGEEPQVFFKTFKADGTMTNRHMDGHPMEGTWSVEGKILELAFSGGQMQISEQYRARIEDDRLILWAFDHDFGSIHVRLGAAFEPPKSEVTTGETYVGELRGVRFSVDLPKGLRLAEDKRRLRRWDPVEGQGFRYTIKINERAQMEKDSGWVTPPCDPTEDLGFGSTHSNDKLLSTGTSRCVPNTTFSVSCRVEHTLGFLREEERQSAGEVCGTIKVLQ